jgi:HK97 family phage portal protein
MDLTALNATPIGAAARAVGRVTYGAVTAATGTLTAMRYQARVGWSLLLNRTRFDYKAEVGDPSTNSIVGSVVGWIARNFPEAPVRIVKEGTTEIAYGPAATGPGAMLRLLERPNEYYSGVLQWMATLVDWIADGNGYWYKVRVQSGSFKGRVIQLWWLPAHMVEPAWDPRRPNIFITHYLYTVDGIAYRIEKRDIVHFRNGLDPRNPRKGRSKLWSLLREIFTDDEASNFTASLMRNLGVPGVILAPSNTTGGAVVKAEPEVIKQKFKDTFGGDNRGEPMVLSAPTDIKVLSWSPEQMNLKELRRIPEERISGVLGVPAVVAQLGAGLDRSTFTNWDTAAVVAYTQGVISDHRLFAAELEVQLLSEFADLESEALDVWFDWTKVQAMLGAIAELWKRLEGPATKGLMTRRRYKQLIGEETTDADDVYVMPNNYMTVPAGGGNPPSGGSRATVTQVPRAALATTEPLLITAGADPEPVRCASCSKMLAQRSGDITGGSIAIKCPRCGVLNEAA